MSSLQARIVRNAIASLRNDSPPDYCWFGPNIPQDALRSAIGKFAAGASAEDILLFIPSQDSGKSGFLFTDKAIYIGETMGFAPRRFAYEDITSLSSDQRYLSIASSDNTKIEWDLTETLLWERSRRKVAAVVIPLLQQIVDPAPDNEASTATAEVRGGAAASHSPVRPKVEIETVELIDWPSVLAFHLPIAILGIPFVMPAIIAMLAKFGGTDSAFDLLYGEMVTVGATGLIPLMYAYGTDLRFSIGRFLAAIALLIFISFQVFASSGAVAPISFGGGLLGAVVAAGLGHAGLTIYRGVQQPEGRRVAKWAVAIIALVAGGLIVNRYIYLRELRASLDAEYQARQQMRDDFWAQMRAAITAAEPDLPTSGQCFDGGAGGASCSLSEGIVFKLYVGTGTSGPCAILETGARFDDGRFFTSLQQYKQEIEGQMGLSIRWSEPVVRAAPNARSRFENDGSLTVCLDSGSSYERADWSRQHVWLASRMRDFYAITVRYHEDFSRLMWQRVDE